MRHEALELLLRLILIILIFHVIQDMISANDFFDSVFFRCGNKLF